MKWVEVTAVAAAALSVAYAASAETLHVTYVGGGEDPSTGLYVLMNVSWEQDLNPTPTTAPGPGWFFVPITNFAGATWSETEAMYFPFGFGMFDFSIDVNTSPLSVYTGDLPNPVFSPSTFTGITYSESGGFDGSGAITFSAVPEPATWALMLAGFVSLGFAGLRARRAATA